MIMLILITLTFLTCACHSFIYRLGECPQVDPMKDFNIEKFSGEWFVIQKFRTSEECIKENITLENDDKYYITRTSRSSRTSSIEKTKVRVCFPENDTLSIMNIDYPLSIGDEGQLSEYVVVTTDYDNYAAVWSCHKMNIGHRQSAQIMSRNKTLERKLVHELREMFHHFDVSDHYFTIVSHEHCNERRKVNDREDCGDKNNDFDRDVHRNLNRDRIDINYDHRNNNNDKSIYFKLGPFKFGASFGF